MYYSMSINMFFIVKDHWEPYFTDFVASIWTLAQYISNARGYNCATLFLEEINTGTWPFRLGEPQK
jgi:hypothetical protein